MLAAMTFPLFFAGLLGLLSLAALISYVVARSEGDSHH
jgi:hypothetical protein